MAALSFLSRATRSPRVNPFLQRILPTDDYGPDIGTFDVHLLCWLTERTFQDTNLLIRSAAGFVPLTATQEQFAVSDVADLIQRIGMVANKNAAMDASS